MHRLYHAERHKFLCISGGLCWLKRSLWVLTPSLSFPQNPHFGHRVELPEGNSSFFGVEETKLC